MTADSVPSADAYLSWGTWVADCPSCTDARAVYGNVSDDDDAAPVRVLDQTCAGGHRFHIVMPSPGAEAEIKAEMDQLPPARRYWYPAGHPMGPVKPDGLPIDQSPEEAPHG